MLHAKWSRIALALFFTLNAVFGVITIPKIVQADSCTVIHIIPGRWSPVNVGEDVGFGIDGTMEIQTVTVTANGNQIGSFNGSVGRVPWTPSAPGQYTITATGHTSSGGSCNFSINFTVNGAAAPQGGGSGNSGSSGGGSSGSSNPPAQVQPSSSSNDNCEMSRTIPSRWSPINVGESVTFHTHGISISSSIKEIRVLVNGSSIGSGGSDTVDVTWTSSQPGAFTISAQGRTGGDWSHYCQDVIGYTINGSGNYVQPVNPSVPQPNQSGNPPASGGSQSGGGGNNGSSNGNSGNSGSSGGSGSSGSNPPSYSVATGLGTAFGQYYAYVPGNITSLNLRSAPNTQSGIIAVMNPNNYYSIVDQTSGWVKVNTSLGQGWVSTQYAQVVDKRSPSVDVISYDPLNTPAINDMANQLTKKVSNISFGEAIRRVKAAIDWVATAGTLENSCGKVVTDAAPGVAAFIAAIGVGVAPEVAIPLAVLAIEAHMDVFSSAGDTSDCIMGLHDDLPNLAQQLANGLYQRLIQ